MIQSGRRLIAARWRFAKSMPHNPHWYTLKETWENPQQFEEAVQMIRDRGITEVYGNRPYTVLFINQFKYWSMGAPVKETTLINRCRRKPLQAQGYDAIAYQYDHLWGTEEAQKEDKALADLLAFKPYDYVFDIGCGNGMIFPYIPEDCSYLGIDPSEKMIQVARDKYITNETHVGNYIVTRFEESCPPRPVDYAICLFGAAGYINHEGVNGVRQRLKQMLSGKGRYFFMYHVPGKIPVTYQKLKLKLPADYVFYGDGVLPGKATPFGENYMIVEGHADLL